MKEKLWHLQFFDEEYGMGISAYFDTKEQADEFVRAHEGKIIEEPHEVLAIFEEWYGG